MNSAAAGVEIKTEPVPRARQSRELKHVTVETKVNQKSDQVSSGSASVFQKEMEPRDRTTQETNSLTVENA